MNDHLVGVHPSLHGVVFAAAGNPTLTVGQDGSLELALLSSAEEGRVVQAALDGDIAMRVMYPRAHVLPAQC